MPSKTFKRKNIKSKNKNNNKNKKSLKRNSKRNSHSKKIRTNVRKMRGGGKLKEDVLSYFNIKNYSVNLANTETMIDKIKFNNKTIYLRAMGDLRQDLHLDATEDNPPTKNTNWVYRFNL